MSFNGNHIIRTVKNRNNPYVMIDKTCLEDTRLSWKAKGLLAYLLSRPDDWEVRVKDLINRSRDGRDSVYAGLSELEKAGYLERTVIRDDKGRIVKWVSMVYERPIEKPEDPLPENPDVANPLPENPDLENPDTGNPDTENPDALLTNKSTNNGSLLKNETTNSKNNNNADEPVDVVVDVLQRYGISVNKKTLTKWRKLADEQTIVRVVHETMARNDVQNVVGYVTSILEAGYTPAVPSKGQTEGAGLAAAGADTVPAAQKAAATVEMAAAAAREVATSIDAQLALDMPSSGGERWITFEDLTEFLNVRPHQHYKYVRFLAEVNEYIDFDGMDYDCVRYAFEIVQKRMKETRENIYYSHRVVLNILSEWANNGVRTKEEAIKYEEARRTRVSGRARASEHATEQDKPLAHAVQHQIEMEKAGLYQEREERKIAEDPELMALLMELEKRKNR